MISRRQLLASIPEGWLLSKCDRTSRHRDSTQPGARTLLLVDDHDVLYRSGTRRLPNSLSRYKRNPVIKSREKPWEVAIAWNSVHFDPRAGRYQLWYQAFSGDRARNKTKRCVVCYAESNDGINWVKPDLGLYSYNDVRETNIVLTGNGGHSLNYGCSVAFDPRDPDPGRRYKMAYFDWSSDSGEEYPGLCVAFSTDGIQWKKYPRAPLLKAAYGDRGQPLPCRNQAGKWIIPLSLSDALDAIWDPPRNVFAIYGKMWIDGPKGRMFWKHAMGHSESRDFIHWSKPQLLLTPDEFDPPWVEFHNSPVFYYNNCYFALLQILHRAVGGGVINVELAISRDGLHWTRPFRKHFFLPRNSDTEFDSGSLFVSPSPVFLKDDFRFYYGGYSQGATGGSDYNLLSGIGLATMPRDRFVGLRPIDKIAQITLKPIPLAGCRSITINADASGGAILPEILDAEGYSVCGFAERDATPATGDSLRHALRWRHKRISELTPGHYMLRLHLRNAEVFAVTIN